MKSQDAFVIAISNLIANVEAYFLHFRLFLRLGQTLFGKRVLQPLLSLFLYTSIYLYLYISIYHYIFHSLSPSLSIHLSLSVLMDIKSFAEIFAAPFACVENVDFAHVFGHCMCVCLCVSVFVFDRKSKVDDAGFASFNHID